MVVKKVVQGYEIYLSIPLTYFFLKKKRNMETISSPSTVRHNFQNKHFSSPTWCAVKFKKKKLNQFIFFF